MSDHQHVKLPSGATANVSPDCPPETLNALDAVAEAAKRDAEGSGASPCSAWLPIETAPKGRKAVMVYRADTKCTYGATWDDITKDWRHFGGSSYPVGGEITHWMPLPSPPNAGADAPPSNT